MHVESVEWKVIGTDGNIIEDLKPAPANKDLLKFFRTVMVINYAAQFPRELYLCLATTTSIGEAYYSANGWTIDCYGFDVRSLQELSTLLQQSILSVNTSTTHRTLKIVRSWQSGSKQSPFPPLGSRKQISLICEVTSEIDPHKVQIDATTFSAELMPKTNGAESWQLDIKGSDAFELLSLSSGIIGQAL